MYRIERVVLALLLALSAAFVLGQDAAQPAEPMAPAPDMADPAAEVPDFAWVRLLHASPNAPDLRVQLLPASEDTSVEFSGDEFESVTYGSFSDYVEVPAGNYMVSAEGVDGMMEEEFSFARGNYYTLTMLGMVLPPEAQADQDEGEQEEGGFVGFFRNLFGGDGDNQDRYAVRFALFDDDLTRLPNEGETLVRVVHAAPGTEQVELAVMGEQGTIVGGVEFGNASRYSSYEGSFADLEVRVAGSRATTLDLTQLNLQTGNLTTVYVVGTPVEQAPLMVLGSSIAPVQVGAAPGDDTVARGMDGDGETAGGGAAGDAEESEDAGEEDAGEEEETTEPEDGQDEQEEEQPEGM